MRFFGAENRYGMSGEPGPAPTRWRNFQQWLMQKTYSNFKQLTRAVLNS